VNTRGKPKPRKPLSRSAWDAKKRSSRKGKEEKLVNRNFWPEGRFFLDGSEVVRGNVKPMKNSGKHVAEDGDRNQGGRAMVGGGGGFGVFFVFVGGKRAFPVGEGGGSD